MSDDADAVDKVAPAHASHRRWEIVIVTVLGLTALATAWSGYQASLWDGIQSSDYSQASAARTNGAQQRTEANQFRIADLTIFENYMDAFINGDDEIAAFYHARFRDEFAVAFDAWLALDPLGNPDAPPSPLAMAQYQLAPDQNADDLEAHADELFAAGETANTNSDIYTLTTLLFAAVLFLAAVSERFDYARARIILLALACVGLISGVAIALSQPITTG